MSKTIEFGAFLNSTPTQARLNEAQRVARGLGVTVSADGSRFAGQGSAGDPVKVTVNIPAGVSITEAVVARGRDAFDALLLDGERLTDYALVVENGETVAAVSLLTGEVVDLADEDEDDTPAAAPAAAPERPRRWSPFRR